MATERLPMRTIREILRLKWLLHPSHRETARSLGISAGAVASVVTRAAGLGLTWPEVLDEAAGGELVDERAMHLLVEIEVEAVEAAVRIAKPGLPGPALEQPVLPTEQFVADERGDEIGEREALRLRLAEPRLQHGGHPREPELPARHRRQCRLARLHQMFFHNRSLGSKEDRMSAISCASSTADR